MAVEFKGNCLKQDKAYFYSFTQWNAVNLFIAYDNYT